MDLPATSTSGLPDLETLYARHHRLVRWIVRAAAIPEPAVDDVTHDVFVAIHRRRAAYDGGELRTWIIGVARSVCHAHRRRYARAQRRLERVEPPAAPPTPEELVMQRHDLRRLQRALEGLDPAQRDAFVHIELEGMTASEAAARSGANVATTYSRLRLARRRVGASLGLDPTAVSPDDAKAEARARKGWAVIAARLAVEPAPPTAAIGLGGWLGGSAIGAAIGAALVGALVLARGDTHAVAEPARAEPVTVVGTAAERAAPSGEPLRVGLAPEPDPEPEPVPTHAPLPRSPAKPPAAAPQRAHPDAPAASPAPTPIAEDVPSPDTTADTLTAEAALLRRAARELDTGRRDLAARTLDEHARRFPDGQLATERQRLRAQIRP